MKKIMILVYAAMMIISAFASRDHFKSGIYGTIEPPDGAKRVWAIAGRDSISAVPVTGKFSMEVKAGNWRVVVEAVDANKSVSLDNILVVDNQFTDVGVIKLP